MKWEQGDIYFNERWKALAESCEADWECPLYSDCKDKGEKEAISMVRYA